MNDSPLQHRVPEEFWKALALTLLGVVITLIGCIYTQDQNRVTKSDLAPIEQSVTQTEQQVHTMSEQFNFLEGQLRAKKVIEK